MRKPPFLREAELDRQAKGQPGGPYLCAYCGRVHFGACAEERNPVMPTTTLKLYLHTIVIVSEYDDYEDLESVARDANQGNARLRGWNKQEIASHELMPGEEQDFFLVANSGDDEP